MASNSNPSRATGTRNYSSKIEGPHYAHALVLRKQIALWDFVYLCCVGVYVKFLQRCVKIFFVCIYRRIKLGWQFHYISVMDQSVVIAIDHSPQSENAVKCELSFIFAVTLVASRDGVHVIWGQPFYYMAFACCIEVCIMSECTRSK